MNFRASIFLGCLAGYSILSAASLFEHATVVQRTDDAVEQTPAAAPAMAGAQSAAVAAPEPAASPKPTQGAYRVVNTPQGRMVLLPDGRLLPLMNSEQARIRMQQLQQKETEKASIPIVQETENMAPSPVAEETAAHSTAPTMAQLAARTPELSADSSLQTMPNKVANVPETSGTIEIAMPDGRIFRANEEVTQQSTGREQSSSLQWSVEIPGEGTAAVSESDLRRGEVRMPDGRVVKMMSVAEMEAQRRKSQKPIFAEATPVESQLRDGGEKRAIGITFQTADGKQTQIFESAQSLPAAPVIAPSN